MPASSEKGAFLNSSQGTSGSKVRYWTRFKEESSVLKFYLWKYRNLAALGLFALLVVDLLDILPPIILKRAVDVTVTHSSLRQLGGLALVYFAVAIVQGICRYGWRMYLIRSSVFAGADMRSSFAHHIFGLSSSFYDRRRIGDLMSLATNDVESVRLAMGHGLLTLADAFLGLAMVPVAMFWLSPKLALLAFIPLPIIPFIVIRNEREIHNRFEKVQESFSKISAMAQESLNGIRVTKSFAKENAQLKRMREAGSEYVQLNLKRAKIQSAFGPSMDFVVSLGLVILLYFGGKGIIESSGTLITLGTFVAFQRYIQKMAWPMAALGLAINTYQRSISSSNRMKQIFAVNTDVPEAAQPVYVRAPMKSSGSVEFKNLNFKFPTYPREILHGISLKVEPGERVAFVGEVAAGKSALLSLLPRLYPVERGMLFVDGVDVNDWPIEELRRQIGYVGQEVFLFSESVVENVAFGLHDRLSGPATVADIEAATRLAGVHEDILGLVNSYQTRLGERGVNLSGGQKQRLTIARAIAKQPSILVLDDALSAVDVHTEERILSGLRARSGRNTELIAAHRISTIKDADRIVVLESGRIAQVGTHNQLINSGDGLYRRFYDQQRLKDDLEKYEAELDLQAEPVV